jgi:Secretion system C-terminal sorting domain
MKKIKRLLLFFIFIAFSQSISLAQCGINILNNPGFDAPLQPAIGNNLIGSFTFNGGWTMTGGGFNVIRTDGSPYISGPDNAQNGTQYVDVVSAAGTVYQDFTISAASTPVSFGGYFSSREPDFFGYDVWVASIDIVSLPSLTVVASSNTRLFTYGDGTDPAQENWYYLEGNTILPSGNYRFIANLGNFGNFDAAFVYQSCALPVNLKYFSGSYENNATSLNWKIESQSNFSHFEVERSLDGRSFNTIANIAYSNRSSYNYLDMTTSINTAYYYRLKMVDTDRKFSYSNTIKVLTKESSNLSIVGNPVINSLQIKGLNSSGQIKIFNMDGNLLVTKNIQSQSLLLDISFLNKGMYLLKYFNGINIETKKFIKQ